MPLPSSTQQVSTQQFSGTNRNMATEHLDIDFPTEIIKEGNVNILVPKLKAFATAPSDYAPSKAPVFYNPVMELNRDIAVLAVQAYQKTVDHPISVCEPLAGCGAMGIRLAAEVKGAEKVLMADISEKAVRLAEHNVALNNLRGSAAVKHKDANLLLNSHSAPRKRFDVIDVDPFGSPVPYLDSALRALRNDGFLALTATDMAPLCGVHPKACIRKYDGKPLRTEYCHELAVRLLAACLVRTAAKQGIGVDVMFSQSSDHYVRVYATINYGAKKADACIKSLGYIFHCFNCFHREAVRQLFPVELGGKCVECGSKLSVAGPVWLGKLFDVGFCELMEEEADRRTFKLGGRIGRMLVLARNEADMPATFYVVDKLCDALSLPVPPVKRVVEALQNEGFRACLTHFHSRGIRSDSPAMKIRQILQMSSGKF
jgi:tRNA (guanine26-N2/guanine27-N2)-dimethyltransferase